MNGIFKNESSNIWIHPITQLNRYLIPIEWLTSLRNKPCCVADILQQTLSPIVICWVLSLSQPTPWRCTPSLRHGSSTDPVFPWWCVPATGTQQPLCVWNTLPQSSDSLCAPPCWGKTGRAFIIWRKTVYFISKTGAGARLSPVWGSFSCFSHSPGLLAGCQRQLLPTEQDTETAASVAVTGGIADVCEGLG